MTFKENCLIATLWGILKNWGSSFLLTLRDGCDLLCIENSYLVIMCVYIYKIGFYLKIRFNQVQKHLWNHNFRLGTGLGTWNTEVNQTKIPALLKLIFWIETDNTK